MGSTLAAALAEMPAEERRAIEGATYKDLHWRLVEATKTGEFTILDFWDALEGGRGWLQGPGEWWPWRAFLAAAFGLPMDERELALYRRCTGRKDAPTEQAREVWMPIGRRARKSAVAAVIAVFVAAYWDHKEYTAPGQRAVIPVLAKNKGDAQTIKQFVDAILSSPTLSFLVKESSAEVVKLTTGVDIQVKAATIMAGRSPAIPLWIMDEIAFFRTENAANPDTEILRGIRPAQATVKRPLGIALSSPYARRGELWAKYKEHFGKEGSDVLVWQADTLTMHPGNPQVAAHVAAEYAADSISAKAEYGAQFRIDVEAYVTDEVLDAATVKGRLELPPVPGWQYMAFTDPSGGASDSMVLAIAHWEPPTRQRTGRVVVDLVHESHAPFDPAVVVEEHAGILKRYRVKDVEGDYYAGEWPSARYREHRIAYWTCDSPKSDLYRNMLPLVRSRTVELLDEPRLRTQLLGLDRHTARSGRDSIDHSPGGHDDVANAVAGVVVRVDRHRPAPRDDGEIPATNTVAQYHKELRKALRDEEEENAVGPNPWARRKK